jgi:hypothetical protein
MTMGRWGQDPAEIGLVEESQAFLDGRYAELAASSGETRVPVWAWMNLLAHGTEAELRVTASQLLVTQGWRQARAFVAGEVIDVIDAGLMSLSQVQRDILVPLELDVLSCQTANQWTPAQLVSGLLGVLPNRDTRAHR